MRNVSEIVYTENLHFFELVEEHMLHKFKKNDDVDEESCTTDYDYDDVDQWHTDQTI